MGGGCGGEGGRTFGPEKWERLSCCSVTSLEMSLGLEWERNVMVKTDKEGE